MGWQPRHDPTGPPPSRESFHLGMARSAFVNGRLDLEEYERSVGHVLAGGTLTQMGGIPAYEPLETEAQYS
jgi:hypothetical protein